jgi:hypothetical protein
MRSLLLVESLDFHPSNQYILVRESPSCLRLAKICVCQVSRRSRWSPWFSWGICTLFLWTGGHVSRLVVNVTWTDLVSIALILQFLSQDWIARFAVSGKQWQDHCLWRLLQCRRQRWQWRSQARLEGQLYKVGIVLGRGHFLEEPPHWLG